MLELRKSKNVTTDHFLCPIGESLGQEADTRANKPETTTVYKDIDKITTKEEERDELKK